MTPQINVEPQTMTQSSSRGVPRALTHFAAFAILASPTIAWVGPDIGPAPYSTSTQIPSDAHLILGSVYEASLGRLVRSLKESMGLTWGQFADLFGVSRRAVHLWVGGGNISADHIARFENIRAKVSRLGAGTPDETRTALFTLGSDGFSAYSSLIGQIGSRSSLRDSRPLGTAELESNFGNPGTLIGSETVDGIERNRV
jgi:transcriptional regulator with XRE-family HTH domain